MFVSVQRRNEFANRVARERPDVDVGQTKPAITAKVTTHATSKPKSKSTKVCCLA